MLTPHTLFHSPCFWVLWFLVHLCVDLHVSNILISNASVVLKIQFRGQVSIAISSTMACFAIAISHILLCLHVCILVVLSL